MFYTYLWLREDGTPYYIGKGSGKRGFESKGHRHICPPKERIITQIWDSEEESFEAEIFLISYYGRLDQGTGCLRNLTDGGENPPSAKGVKRSAEFCRQVKVRSKGLKRTKEAKQKMREAKLGKRRGPHSEAHRLKISLALQGNKNGKSSWGHKHTEEARKKMSQTKRKNKELRRVIACQKHQ